MKRTALLAIVAIAVATVAAYAINTPVLGPDPAGYAIETLLATTGVAVVILLDVGRRRIES
jgi:hypothetical protein